MNFRSIENQKSDDELSIGAETRDFLSQSMSEHKQEFFVSIRAYFVEACDYIKKFPLQTEFLTHAEVRDIMNRTNVSLVQYCTL